MTVPTRNAKGHWLPGQTGNPGGRTSALAEVRALLKPHVPLYVQRLNELVRHPDPDVALPALREALDRLLGKPVASIEQDVRTLDMGQLYLAAVKAANAPQTIEGTAAPSLPSHGDDDATDGEW
jgi:hypothetical protein